VIKERQRAPTGMQEEKIFRKQRPTKANDSNNKNNEISIKYFF
jgi:hypothetical protein